ncbi:MAG: glutaredoxin family protein [Microbacterium sp.]|nr:glutaredoxin family protein [Microbacterium sp.]
MNAVTVYSTGPSCHSCRLTCFVLTARDIPFRIADITAPDLSEVPEFLTSELGYSEAPVVIIDDEPQHPSSGFRPDLVDRLARHQSQRTVPGQGAVSIHNAREGRSWTSATR